MTNKEPSSRLAKSETLASPSPVIRRNNTVRRSRRKPGSVRGFLVESQNSSKQYHAVMTLSEDEGSGPSPSGFAIARRARTWPTEKQLRVLHDPTPIVVRRNEPTDTRRRPLYGNLRLSYLPWIVCSVVCFLLQGIGLDPPSPERLDSPIIKKDTASAQAVISLADLTFVHFPDLFSVLGLDAPPWPDGHPWNMGTTGDEELDRRVQVHLPQLQREIDSRCRRLRAAWSPDRRAFRENHRNTTTCHLSDHDSTYESTTMYGYTKPIWPKPWGILTITCDVLRNPQTRQDYLFGMIRPQQLIHMASTQAKGHFAAFEYTAMGKEEPSESVGNAARRDRDLADIIPMCREMTEEMEHSRRRNTVHRRHVQGEARLESYFRYAQQQSQQQHAPTVDTRGHQTPQPVR